MPDDYEPPGRVDVTWVSRGTLAKMLESDAVPSPKLQAAIERARIRRTVECSGGDACEC